VAAAMAASQHEQVWECTHLGGDRFAANVVALPFGNYYGRVDALDALAIIDATERGSVVTRLSRGRSSLTPVEQAAQLFARVELGDDRAESLLPVCVEATSGQSWQVTLGRDAARVIVDVVSEMSAPIRATCSHKEAVPMRELRGVKLRMEAK